MIVTYKQCDLCNSRIDAFSNELNIKYKARRNTPRYFSIEDVKNKIPIGTEWKEIDVCEECIKEIISKRCENEVNS